MASRSPKKYDCFKRCYENTMPDGRVELFYVAGSPCPECGGTGYATMVQHWQDFARQIREARNLVLSDWADTLKRQVKRWGKKAQQEEIESTAPECLFCKAAGRRVPDCLLCQGK